jgi:5-hydroxyisourate hydrolase-like protein (transthyretin family)
VEGKRRSCKGTPASNSRLALSQRNAEGDRSALRRDAGTSDGYVSPTESSGNSVDLGGYIVNVVGHLGGRRKKRKQFLSRENKTNSTRQVG